MLAGDPAVACDRVGGDPAEPPGLPHAAPLGDVLQHRLGLLRGEPGVEQRGALALGEAGLAGAAAEHPPRLPRAVAVGYGQVSDPSLAVVGAPGIQAAEAREVVHGFDQPMRSWVEMPSCALPEGYTTGPGLCNTIESRRPTLLNHESP